MLCVLSLPSFRRSEPSAHVGEHKHHPMRSDENAEIAEYRRDFLLCCRVESIPHKTMFRRFRAFSVCELTQRAPTHRFVSSTCRCVRALHGAISRDAKPVSDTGPEPLPAAAAAGTTLEQPAKPGRAGASGPPCRYFAGTTDAYSSGYCGGLAPTRSVTLGYFP